MRSCQLSRSHSIKWSFFSEAFLSGASASGSEDEHRLDAFVEVIVIDNVGSGGGERHF